mmetsp:Transcript_8566/g.37779  ORF Transcript_8566/g.37779 Transcript_8566/m.37779 type:complete len:383 (-) Transcript_8566:2580-3728(-)
MPFRAACCRCAPAPPPFAGRGVAATTIPRDPAGVPATVSLAGVHIACCSIAVPLLPSAVPRPPEERGVLIAIGVLMISLNRPPRAGVIETDSRRFRFGRGVCMAAIAACRPGVIAVDPGPAPKAASARFLGAGICITLRLPASGVGWNPGGTMSSFSRCAGCCRCRCSRRNSARFSFSRRAVASSSRAFRSSSADFTGAIRTSRFAGPARLRNRACHLTSVLGFGILNEPAWASRSALPVKPVVGASEDSPDSPPYSSPPAVFFPATTPGENTPALSAFPALPAFAVPFPFASAPSPSLPVLSTTAPTPRLDRSADISLGTAPSYLGESSSSTKACSACIPTGCNRKLSGLTTLARCFAAFFVRLLSDSDARSECSESERCA